MDPLVAVTVKVTGVLAQPDKVNIASASTTIFAATRLRSVFSRFRKERKNAMQQANTGIADCESCRSSAVGDVLKVSIVVTVAPLGVTVEGVKTGVPYEALRPVTVNVMGSLKPMLAVSGARVSVHVALGLL